MLAEFVDPPAPPRGDPRRAVASPYWNAPKKDWGYHSLVVSLANTQEPLFLVTTEVTLHRRNDYRAASVGPRAAVGGEGGSVFEQGSRWHEPTTIFNSGC